MRALVAAGQVVAGGGDEAGQLGQRARVKAPDAAGVVVDALQRARAAAGDDVPVALALHLVGGQQAEVIYRAHHVIDLRGCAVFDADVADLSVAGAEREMLDAAAAAAVAADADDPRQTVLA